MKGRSNLICIFLVGSFLMIPRVVGAEEGMPFLEKGTQEIGFGSGYGWSVRSNRYVESVPFYFRWGCVLTEPKGSSILRGNWETLLEGSASYLFHNQRKYGIGVSGLLRYNFLSGKRLVPFLQCGVGVWHSSVEMHGFPNDFNFSSQGGAGLQYFIKKNISIQGGYRFQHFSNAGLYSKNSGLNLNKFWMGCAYFF